MNEATVRALIRRFAAGITDGDKGDISVSSGVWTIDAGAVDNTKLADMATARIKGRTTAGTGDPEDLTGTQATALLDTFTSAAKGLVPASGGGTTNFLRADGTWTTPPAPSGTTPLGTITTTSGSSQSLSSLVLTGYNRLFVVVNGVSAGNTTAVLRFGTATISDVLASASDTWNGTAWVDLAAGVIGATIGNVGRGGNTGYSTATTSVTVSLSTSSFDAGSVVVYGVV